MAVYFLTLNGDIIYNVQSKSFAYKGKQTSRRTLLFFKATLCARKFSKFRNYLILLIVVLHFPNLNICLWNTFDIDANICTWKTKYSQVLWRLSYCNTRIQIHRRNCFSFLLLHLAHLNMLLNWLEWREWAKYIQIIFFSWQAQRDVHKHTNMSIYYSETNAEQ